MRKEVTKDVSNMMNDYGVTDTLQQAQNGTKKIGGAIYSSAVSA